MKNANRKYDITWILPILEDHPVDSNEFRILLKRQGLKSDHNTISSFVNQISKDYALYEPAPGVFKILTKEDLDRYENRKRKSYINAI